MTSKNRCLKEIVPLVEDAVIKTVMSREKKERNSLTNNTDNNIILVDPEQPEITSSRSSLIYFDCHLKSYEIERQKVSFKSRPTVAVTHLFDNHQTILSVVFVNSFLLILVVVLRVLLLNWIIIPDIFIFGCH